MIKDTSATFRMYMEIRFNRPYDSKKHFISCGGNEMVFGSKYVHFDLTEIAGYQSKEDPAVVTIEEKQPDYDYENTADLEPEDFGKLEEIRNIWIDSGGSFDDDEDFYPVELKSLSFTVINRDGTFTDHDYENSQAVRDFSAWKDGKAEE